MKRLDVHNRSPLTAGFTLIEIIIVIAVIAILAGIATPSIVKNIRDSRVARARSDCKEIATTMASFYKDTGQWPNGTSGAPGTLYYYTLKTAGTDPTGMWGSTWATRADTFDNQLINNTPGYPTTGELRWDGPYQTEYKPDPWNHPYICGIYYLKSGDTHPVYVVSAGPDGVLQTRPGQLLAGDDIGFRLQ